MLLRNACKAVLNCNENNINLNVPELGHIFFMQNILSLSFLPLRLG